MFLGTPLCFARFVSFLTCDAACRFSATCSKSTYSNWMTSWVSFVDGLRLLQILLADGMRFLSMSSRMSSKIFWSSASTFATYSLAYDACCSFSYFHCCVQFIPLCEQPQLQTEVPSEPPSHVFRSSASFAAIDLASSAICNFLLHLLLFLCHTLPHIIRFCVAVHEAIS